MVLTRVDRSSMVERYAYCLCLHVKPATIFIGSIKLVSVTLYVAGYANNTAITHLTINNVLYLFTLFKAESLLSATRYLTTVFFNGPDMKIPQITIHQAAIPMYLLSASVSAMLLYGVTKSRPSYLMPFFWLRLCEFMFLLPTFISTLYEHPFHPNNFYEAQSMPGSLKYERAHWNGFQNSHPIHKSLAFTTVVLIVQAYFLCVVWKCYRYLKVRELILPVHMPSSAADLVIPPLVTMNMSPPDYETATKGSGPPPPDYETAMKANQPEKANEEPHVVTSTSTSDQQTNPSSANSQPTVLESQAGPSGSPQASQEKTPDTDLAKSNEQ